MAIVVYAAVSARPLLVSAQTAGPVGGDPGSAPTPAATVNPSPTKRWSVVVATGPTSSGLAAQLEAGMRSTHFDDEFDGTHFPFSGTAYGDSGFPWLIDVHYAVRARYGVGLIVSQADIGSTFGYRKLFNFLSLSYAVSTVAPIFSVEPRQGIRLGVGPAFYRTSLAEADEPLSSAERRANKLGVVVDGSIEVPSRSRFLADLRVQYRRVGSETAGPFVRTSLTPNEPPAIFRQTSVSYNHWFVGAGFGVRF
jgi:hypothetical protein